VASQRVGSEGQARKQGPEFEFEFELDYDFGTIEERAIQLETRKTGDVDQPPADFFFSPDS
jgi:hypothetical protein